MRLGILAAAALALTLGAASAQQTCTTRSDGSYNCTTTNVAASATATTAGSINHRMFEPDETGLLRVPTQDGEMLFHCDNAGPCKQIGVNPPVINRQ